jgi:hypothetical protein
MFPRAALERATGPPDIGLVGVAGVGKRGPLERASSAASNNIFGEQISKGLAMFSDQWGVGVQDPKLRGKAALGERGDSSGPRGHAAKGVDDQTRVRVGLSRTGGNVLKGTERVDRQVLVPDVLGERQAQLTG